MHLKHVFHLKRPFFMQRKSSDDRFRREGNEIVGSFLFSGHALFVLAPDNSDKHYLRVPKEYEANEMLLSCVRSIINCVLSNQNCAELSRLSCLELASCEKELHGASLVVG